MASYAAACLVASPALVEAFIVPPRTARPIESSFMQLYFQEGAPYPVNGGDSKSLVGNSTVLNGDDTTASNADEEIDIVGAGSLGDIMAGSADDIIKHPPPTTVIDGLVTKEGGELNAKFSCSFTPMERIALTANGNLQRIFSSYYDSPVHVHVDSCTRRKKKIPANGSSDVPQQQIGFNHTSIDFDPTSRPEVINGDAIWDRVVHIQVHNQTICKATSIISVQSAQCIQLIEEGTVGLGQMFRYLNKLPTFSLLDAGKEGEVGSDESYFQGGMWRTYELQCEEMTCLIHEEFHRDAWDII